MRTATTSAIPAVDSPDRAVGWSFAARLGGIAIASLTPAIFWCAILEFGSDWLGYPLSTRSVALIGSGIAVFLFAICAPLMLRGPAPTLAHDEGATTSRARTERPAPRVKA
ncbi:MAG: hypothetical protein JSR99_05365 [Proteobacteria bacterium]|nr:hypothetical protein [Pseudomonadota bacterium]